MNSVKTLVALLPLAALATLSCSKTQDSAPERRIFGNPPTIQSVNPDFFDREVSAECDFTEIVLAIFCQSGYLDTQPQTGRGFTVVADPDGSNRRIAFSDVPTTVPGVFIQGTYNEFNFEAIVTDPESTPEQSNILLVSASYVQPESKSENSLVLFDDGSENEFKFPQRAFSAEDCTVDLENGVCSCTGAIYKIKSGDLQKGDGTFTRKFALVDRTSSGFFQDCVMRTRNEVPVFTASGETFQFKFEAVDRQGNLATWPTSLTAVSEPGSFGCNGDSCGCCILHFHSQLATIEECRGLDGMVTSSYPNGFCKEGL